MNIFKKIFVRGPKAVAKVPKQIARATVRAEHGVVDAVHVAKGVNSFEKAKEEAMESKSFLKSKTFWFNLLSGAAQVVGFVPPKYGVPATAVINILLRFVSENPIHILQ